MTVAEDSGATAMGDDSPGNAPTVTPITTPPKMSMMLKGSSISKMP